MISDRPRSRLLRGSLLAACLTTAGLATGIGDLWPLAQLLAAEPAGSNSVEQVEYFEVDRPSTIVSDSDLSSLMRQTSFAQVGDAPPVPQDFMPPAVPVLPETEVQATPMLQPFGPQNQRAYDPVVDGSMFSSPLVDGYRANSSTAGTLFDIPDADFPGTVNVIPKAALRDQQALRFYDAIRNAPGVNQVGNGLFYDQVFIRGLEMSTRDFRKDGFFDPTFVPRDFQNIERIEILKGPASVLYGAGSPSGMVNLITKKPIDARFGEAGFTFGSFGQQRYTFDVNTASESGNVLFRLNGAQEDTETFRDFDFLSRTLFAPSVTLQLDEFTRLNWYGEWHKDHRRGDQGMPAIGGNALSLPYSRYVGEPANDFIHFEEFRQTLLLERELQNGWTLQWGGSSLFFELPGSVTAASDTLGLPDPPVTPVPPPFYYRSRTNILNDDEQAQSMIVNLAGETNIFGFRHEMLFGMEYIYFDSNSSFAYGLVPPINVQDPVYLNPPDSTIATADFSAYRQQRVGWYVQDLVELTEKWKVLSGVRFDTLDLTFNRTINFGAPMTFLFNEEFNRASPRVGVVYQPFANEDLALYGNYSQSFNAPGGGAYINTTGLKPVLGDAFETGFKALLTENFALNVAGFYVTRQNADLNTGSFFLTQIGEERSRGVEVSLVGQITDRLSTISNYTYTDVRLFDALDPTINGNRQRNVPLNMANFWTRYNLVQNSQHTIGAALGMVWLDRRPGDLTNSFNLPSFVRWDMGLFYQRGRVQTGLYAENILDTRYAASSVNEYQVYPGAPANVRATVSWIW